MNIAAITITYNDDYKFTEWCNHYLEYKNELYLHVVIDNNSTEEYYNKVKSFFTDSVIVRRSSNGGCTIAYNEGIRIALADEGVDAIMLIGNDMRLEKGMLTHLYDFLFSNEGYGMVEPVILAKDSDLIEDFGCKISYRLIMRPLNYGERISSVPDLFHIVETVTGGMNLAKREFYEKVGLQDEKLFMYSDEVDMGIRAAKKGFKMAATKKAIAWHQHINPKERASRLPYTSYLIGRNKVYLARKHFGFWRSLNQLVYHLFMFLKGILKHIGDREGLIHQYYFIRGSYNGFLGNMGLSGIIQDFKQNEDYKKL